MDQSRDFQRSVQANLANLERTTHVLKKEIREFCDNNEMSEYQTTVDEISACLAEIEKVIPAMWGKVKYLNPVPQGE